MTIHGLAKLTLLDYPGKVACTVFTGGCNFRCSFCHNAGLVLNPDGEGVVGEEEFFSFLQKRSGILDGVCVTGGEPLINGDIYDFLAKIKAIGLSVKLDTNGTSPDKLSALIDTATVDYVAMDIKNSKEKYPLTIGRDKSYIAAVEESADILMRGKVDFEFRTTVVKELHDIEDMRLIGKWLCGNEKYFLQNFVDSGHLLGQDLSGFSRPELEMLLSELRKYIPSAQIRG